MPREKFINPVPLTDKQEITASTAIAIGGEFWAGRLVTQVDFPRILASSNNAETVALAWKDTAGKALDGVTTNTGTWHPKALDDAIERIGVLIQNAGQAQDDPANIDARVLRIAAEQVMPIDESVRPAAKNAYLLASYALAASVAPEVKARLKAHPDASERDALRERILSDLPKLLAGEVQETVTSRLVEKQKMRRNLSSNFKDYDVAFEMLSHMVLHRVSLPYPYHVESTSEFLGGVLNTAAGAVVEPASRLVKSALGNLRRTS